MGTFACKHSTHIGCAVRVQGNGDQHVVKLHVFVLKIVLNRHCHFVPTTRFSPPIDCACKQVWARTQTDSSMQIRQLVWTASYSRSAWVRLLWWRSASAARRWNCPPQTVALETIFRTISKGRFGIVIFAVYLCCLYLRSVQVQFECSTQTQV